LASRTGENTGLAWLDVLLSKEKLGRATSYFSSVKLVDKAQACVLPLFFGTVDACVVDEINLNLAKELNPQLDQLKVLARSRPMIEGVIATPIKPYPYHEELMETLLSLNKDTRGRQVLMVFKTDRLVPLQSSDLDSSRDLWKDYYRLPGAIANTPPGAPSPAAKGFHEKERF
jgi:ABC-type phosphate/phosphonate transport system substrate-binding protein